MAVFVRAVLDNRVQGKVVHGDRQAEEGAAPTAEGTRRPRQPLPVPRPRRACSLRRRPGRLRRLCEVVITVMSPLTSPAMMSSCHVTVHGPTTFRSRMRGIRRSMQRHAPAGICADLGSYTAKRSMSLAAAAAAEQKLCWCNTPHIGVVSA